MITYLDGYTMDTGDFLEIQTNLEDMANLLHKPDANKELIWQSFNAIAKYFDVEDVDSSASKSFEHETFDYFKLSVDMMKHIN